MKKQKQLKAQKQHAEHLAKFKAGVMDGLYTMRGLSGGDIVVRLLISERGAIILDSQLAGFAPELDKAMGFAKETPFYNRAEPQNYFG